MNQQQQEVIVEMYKEGASYSVIAKEIGISDHIVKHWVRSNRVEHDLPRRRNLAEKAGGLSTSAWLDSKWNIERGVELISRKWA